MDHVAITTLVRRFEGDDRFDATVARLHAIVARYAERFGGRELLSGTALGHPVHPLLVSAPIGCFTAAMIADLVGERGAARTLTGAGVLASLPTAAAGLSDWVDTADAERRVGFLHLTANFAAVGLYASSWVARRRGRELQGRLFGAVGGGVMTVAGWLGGHLAYAMGVGVDTTAFEGGPTEWTDIARPGDAPSRRAVADGIALAVFEDDAGNPSVLADRCTHRGGPLSDGDVVDGCVTCPWHGSRFDIADGHVARGPATQPQPVYEVRVSGEGTQVRRDEPRSLRRNPVRAWHNTRTTG
jgi:nitrite reductase/ring-hydroxylating ferredoxin subunit/uncharacterized membrane protein